MGRVSFHLGLLFSYQASSQLICLFFRLLLACLNDWKGERTSRFSRMVRTANFVSCHIRWNNVGSGPRQGAGFLAGRPICWHHFVLLSLTLRSLRTHRELGRYYSICPTSISLITTIFITLLVLQLLLSVCQVDIFFIDFLLVYPFFPVILVLSQSTGGIQGDFALSYIEGL